MAQLFRQRKHGPGRVLVQNAGNGRAMIIPDMIPELVAWLYMIGQRYERTYRTTQANVRKHSDRYLTGVNQYCEWAIEFINRLMQLSTDKFARHEWWVSWADTCDKFGITEPTKSYCNFELDDTFNEGGGI
jgi:hypothetical protein